MRGGGGCARTIITGDASGLSQHSGVGCAPPWHVRCHPVPPPPTHTQGGRALFQGPLQGERQCAGRLPQLPDTGHPQDPTAYQAPPGVTRACRTGPLGVSLIGIRESRITLQNPSSGNLKSLPTNNLNLKPDHRPPQAIKIPAKADREWDVKVSVTVSRGGGRGAGGLPDRGRGGGGTASVCVWGGGVAGTGLIDVVHGLPGYIGVASANPSPFAPFHTCTGWHALVVLHAWASVQPSLPLTVAPPLPILLPSELPAATSCAPPYIHHPVTYPATVPHPTSPFTPPHRMCPCIPGPRRTGPSPCPPPSPSLPLPPPPTQDVALYSWTEENWAFTLPTAPPLFTGGGKCGTAPPPSADRHAMGERRGGDDGRAEWKLGIPVRSGKPGVRWGA